MTKQSILENHIKAKHTNKTSVLCEKNFETTFVENYHLCIRKTKLTCPLCEFLTNDERKLKLHMETSHIKPYLKCRSCYHETDHNDEFDNHKKMEHKGKANITGHEIDFILCNGCKQWYINKPFFNNHKHEQHQAPSSFQCKLCTNEYKTELGFVWHTESNHEGKQFQCTERNYTSTHSDMNTHNEIHGQKSNGFTLQCKLCDYKYRRNPNLQKHTRQKHAASGDCKYTCSFCEFKNEIFIKIYKHKSGVPIPENQVILVVEPILCKKCGYNCQNCNKLKKHIEVTHTNHGDKNKPNDP